MITIAEFVFLQFHRRLWGEKGITLVNSKEGIDTSSDIGFERITLGVI